MANIVIAMTLIGGVISLLNTTKSFFPTRNSRNISIQVAFPGASPVEMEEGVTLKIEQAINSIVGIDEIFSTSSENRATVNVSTLTGHDIDEVFTEIKNAVDGINSFPVSAEKPLIFKVKPQTTALWLTISGDVDLLTLKRFGEDIEDELLASGIISQVRVVGYNDREISIEVSEQNLTRYNLTFDDVASAVRSNNQDISAGSIKSIDEEILIRSNAKTTDAGYIAEIVLRSNPDGSDILLRDIATIKEQWVDVPNQWTINGKEAVFIEVKKLEEEDLELISNYVHNYTEEYNKKNSAVQITIPFDFFEFLSQRIDMLTTNGLIGLSLVLISLSLFLSLRLSFWVAWGIPSSFLGMFIVGSFFGLTINMMSLFGMILVIGILVDDGIVIAENIFVHFEKTGNPVKAAINGTMEVLPAVATSVTTTIVAFTPLLILTGGLEFLKDMAIVVIASLAFSLLEAFFVLPAHLSSKAVLSIKKEGTRSYKIRKALNKIVDFMRYRLYGNALRYTMKYRALSVAAMIAIFIITGGLFSGGLIKSTFFPQIPFAAFNINLVFKPGTRATKVDKYLNQLETKIWEVNEDLKEENNDPEDYIRYTFSATGTTMDGSEQGGHAGGIQVFHKELDGTGINSFDLINLISEKVGDIPEAEKFTIGGGNQFGKPVSVRLLGKNIEELEAAKLYLKSELSKIKDLKEIQDDVAIGRREMLFELTPEAYYLGLNHNDITRQIRQGFFGEEVQRLQKGNDEVRVWVRYPGKGRLSVGQLEQMKIKTNDDREIPLKRLTNYGIERGVAGIKHYNTERSITVDAELIDPFIEVPPIMKEVEDNIVPEMQARFPGVKVDYGGQSRQSERAQNEIALYFGGAIIIIFFLIMITFRSFYQSVIVMMMIPIGWVGASWGHGIENIPVSLLSAWGMIALSGVIINDAVVFMAKFNTLIKKEGQTVYQAAYNAGISRFRPIMLTSITTVAGLYPLIMESSFQAQFLIPMAVAVAYGVLFGTFFILLFFPVLIIIFNDVRRAASWLWEGKKPSREDVERVVIDMRRNEKIRKSA